MPVSPYLNPPTFDLSKLRALTLATEHTPAPRGSPTKDSLIAFDWDDTLLPSSFLSSKGLRLDSEQSRVRELEAPLTEISHSVIGVLTLALQYGPVTVITNAETGWVHLSCAKFMPLVVPLLAKLTIVSARSTYEQLFPESPLKWKFYCFQERISALSLLSGGKKEKNILSFGDSHVEREAVRACTRGMANTRTKSVKFAERPSIEQLRRQIELVTNCFAYIHNHEGDLDLQLTVTVGNAPQDNKAQGAPMKASDGTESKSMYGNALQQQDPLHTSEEKPMA